jgi:uncharacterized OB-fold protein
MKTEAQPLGIPHPSWLSRPFWEACHRGEFIVQECDRCGRRWFPPDLACIYCSGTEWHWGQSLGRGSVYSYTVVYRPTHPHLDAPYVIASVDLDDGFSMMTNIVDCPPSDVTVGMSVKVKFVRISEDVTLPFFVPVS